MTPPVLAATDLAVGHHRRALLPPLTFAVAPGARWAIVGRNGAGKSTLVKTLLGLLPPVAGRVERPAGADVAYVPQRHQLEAHVPMRARDVVLEGLEAGMSFLSPFRVRGARERAMAALARTEASAFAEQNFATLSEGQKQRVLLARALVATPRLLVLDEPTAAMDAAAEARTLAVLDQLRQDAGTAVLLVSHHLSATLGRADHAIFLDADHGVAVAGKPAAVVAEPVFRRHFAALVDEGAL